MRLKRQMARDQITKGYRDYAKRVQAFIKDLECTGGF